MLYYELKKKVMFIKKIHLFTLLLLINTIVIGQSSIEITNESAINSEELEFSPTFYSKGIVFVSTKASDILSSNREDKKIGENFMTLFYAERNVEGQLGEAEEFSYNLGSRFHEGPLSFSRDGRQVYFTRNNYVNRKVFKDSKGVVKLKIFTASRQGDDWGEIRELSFNTDEYDEMHPTISADGNRLFFTSNREGGFGGSDIYMAVKVGDSWSDPINLGPSINTTGNDAFPFLHESGTLYFASDSRDGFGGYDVYSASTTDYVNWTDITNVGTPFNSDGDDFGFIINKKGTKGYFTSNRTEGAGQDDIYSFSVPERTLTPSTDQFITATICAEKEGTTSRLEGVQMKVFERSLDGNLKDLDSDFVITLEPTNSPNEYGLNVKPKGQSTAKYTNTSGEIEAMLSPGRDYRIIAEKDGFKPTEMNITTRGKQLDENLSFCVQLTEDRCMGISGTVLNMKSKSLMPDVTVSLTNHCTNQVQTARTNIDGTYRFSCVDCSCEFTIKAEKASYITASERIRMNNANCYNGGEQYYILELASVTASTNYNNSMSSVPYQNNSYSPYENNSSVTQTYDPSSVQLQAGSVIELPNIYYDFDEYFINMEAAVTLDQVVELMMEYPSLEIELAAHTDARGRSKYNRYLSKKRAREAVNYILSKGVESYRLVAEGYGESELRNHCDDGVDCSEEEHQYNRRTEVRVKNFDRSDISVRYRNDDPTLVRKY